MSGLDGGKLPEHGHVQRQPGADDEVDFPELWRVLVKYRRMIMTSALIAALLSTAISLLLPNIYRAEILLGPAQSDDSKAGGLASALGGLGGLASMTGISLSGGGNTEENLAVLKSRDFLWKFVQERNLM